MTFILNFEIIYGITNIFKFKIMHEPENKPKDTTETEDVKQLEQALKQDRLGGWPSIIGVAGTIALFLNMLFRGWDEYVNIGSASLYLWELCLYFFAIAVAFLPASLHDAKCLAAGKQRPSIQSYIKGIVIRLLIAVVVIIIIYQLL